MFSFKIKYELSEDDRAHINQQVYDQAYLMMKLLKPEITSSDKYYLKQNIKEVLRELVKELK